MKYDSNLVGVDSVFCFISCLIIIIVRTISGLGDTNLYKQLKAIVETLLKGNVQRHLLDDT